MVLALSPYQAGATTLERIAATGVMTVCADPANLPLSDARLDPPGYDVEIAVETAKILGAKLQYHWFATAHTARVLRQLYDEKCDFVVGIPIDKRLEGAGPRLALSKPYLTTGFAVVVRKDVQAKALEDLKGMRIGVEMHSVPDFALFSLGHDRGLYASQAAMFKALADGELAAAVMWAPVAGWLAKQQPSVQWKILPGTPPEFTFPLAVGVRKGDPEFLDAINAAIDSLVGSGRRDQILEKYGFPKILASRQEPQDHRLSERRAEPEPRARPADDGRDRSALKRRMLLALGPGWKMRDAVMRRQDWAGSEPRMIRVVGGRRKATETPAAPETPAATEAPAATETPAAPLTRLAIHDKGYGLYHSACAKCHGRSAISGGIYPDLRKFQGSDEDFLNTVKNGRSGTVMPAWKDYFSEEELQQIQAYVKSVSKD